MKKIFFFFFISFLPIIVLADDITKNSNVYINDQINNLIIDNNENTYASIKSNDIISIESNEDIESIYIVYELKSSTGKISFNNATINIGENNFLHEYIKIDKKTTNIQIQYDNNVKIAEIYILNEGTLPEYVEVWNKPCEKADLLLFSTHSDDEQLFFLGLMPTYVARGANVQVVYFTNHNNNPKRLHEQLHGLYTVGIRNYPIMGIIPDAYSTSLDGAINNMKNAKLTTDDALLFEVQMIRRFKPLVIVGHDEKGEYGHGQHILNTYILKDAIIKANDANYDEESILQYGLWEPKKVYLHLYKENKIIMDYDTPLEYFDGLTAYEVSKKGYSKHKSQQGTWFTGWINGKKNEFTKSTDIKTYSPNEFGLYYSTVGIDNNKNDMFENITMYKDVVIENPIIENNNPNINENTTSFKKQSTYFYALITLSSFLILISLFLFLKHKK